MALQLTKEESTGLSGNYWKILSVTVYADDARCECKVGLFKDSTASSAGKTPMIQEFYIWSDADNPCTIAAMANDDALKLCYDKLKTLGEFSGATDV